MDGVQTEGPNEDASNMAVITVFLELNEMS